MRHVVALSGGKDSTAMALRLREVEPSTPFEWVCTPTGDEPDSLFEHWGRLAATLGGRITPVVHPRGLVGLIEDQAALPNWRQRWCTRMLKIEPFARYLAAAAPAVSCVGLRADEPERQGGVYADIPGVVQRYPLREWGWGVDEVWGYLEARGFRHPEAGGLFPQPDANPFPIRTDCDLCFFQRLDEWYALWRCRPAKYAEGERLERLTGHTFRSPGRDTWPASLEGLRAEFEAGRIPARARDPLRTLQCRACSL